MLPVIGGDIPLFFETGERAGRCVDVEMLRHPYRTRRVCSDRPDDRLRRHYELRRKQGEQTIKSTVPCPICGTGPATRIVVCSQSKPFVRPELVVCDFDSFGRIGSYATNLSKDCFPLRVMPAAYKSIFTALELTKNLRVMRQVTDLLLKLAGYPPADSITSEEAVRFFLGLPPTI